MIESLLVIVSILVCVVIGFLLKAWKESFDDYFAQKAVNLATKQDVEEITEKTESVLARYREDQSKFEADLQYKYELYKEQYVNLYATLYWEVCISEATRGAVNNIAKANYTFEDVPIASYEDVDTVIKRITELVEKNKQLVSPQLMKIVVSLKVVEFEIEQRLSLEVSIIKELKERIVKEMIKTIVKDYHHIRKELKLDTENEVEQLMNGNFMSFWIT